MAKNEWEKKMGKKNGKKNKYANVFFMSELPT